VIAVSFQLTAQSFSSLVADLGDGLVEKLSRNQSAAILAWLCGL